MKKDEAKILLHCDEYLKKPVPKAKLITTLSKYLKHTLKNDESMEETVDVEKDITLILAELKSEFPDEIISSLRIDVEDLYNEVKDTYSIDETEEFANRIIEFSKSNDIQKLTEYGYQLIASIENFNFDRIEELVDAFDTVIN